MILKRGSVLSKPSDHSRQMFSGSRSTNWKEVRKERYLRLGSRQGMHALLQSEGFCWRYTGAMSGVPGHNRSNFFSGGRDSGAYDLLIGIGCIVIAARRKAVLYIRYFEYLDPMLYSSHGCPCTSDFSHSKIHNCSQRLCYPCSNHFDIHHHHPCSRVLIETQGRFGG